MKIKQFVITGLIAIAMSPAFAADFENFKITVDKDGTILMDEDSAKLAKALEQYNASLKLSEDIRAERTKCKSNDGTWFDGYCISKNPCTSKKATDKKHCIKHFEDIQVATNTRAAYIVQTYVKNILKWEGCAELKIPKSSVMGQDYIQCINPADGNVRMFEFDDISESDNRVADRDYAYAMCLALGGKASGLTGDSKNVTCSKITKKTCEDKLNGKFESNKCKIAF